MASDVTPERWRQVSAVLDAALDCSEGERPDILDRLCGPDASLRQDVERLLAADATTGGLLDEPNGLMALADDRDADAEAPDLPEGAEVGHYKVLREIGRGGMGVVFLAARADGTFDQQVALKVVRMGLTSDEERHRFLRERQILAALNHPNIARLYDGGATADGRPYLAMEYVEGEPITKYCDAHGLGLEARLTLFLDVCHAVEAAHRHLVVHRDLKPSNILVTRERRIKLLDFGIAKPLVERASATTRTVVHALTPEYAAPEQILQAPVTVATDVYGLGVILYELLTSRRPFQAATVFELPAAVVQQDPPRPSASVVPEPDTALRLGLPVRRLRRRLRGDLDTIVLTALRKEPERRYQSVERLRRDLERYLRREPILAHPDSRTYRAKRFVQRHSIGVAAALLVLLSLAGGLAGTIWQARVASQQARRAEAATDFMAGVFRLSDPSVAIGETVTAREILDLAARRIESELGGTPEIQADMFALIGRIYTDLGLYRNAEPLLMRAIDIRKRLYPDERWEIGDSLDAIGVLQGKLGRYAEAEETLRRALAVLSRTAGAVSAETATSLNHLAELQLLTASHAQAAASAESALGIRQRLFGNRQPAVAESLALMAEAARAEGSLTRATSLDREALDIRRAHFGENHPAVIASLSSLASDSAQQRLYREAEELYREALASARRTLGPDHPDTLEIVSRQGIVAAEQGRFAAAEVLLREALVARRLRVGERHPSLIANINALAGTVQRLGRHDEAEGLYREALAIAESGLGANHLEVAKNLADLGVLLTERGHAAEAEPLLRRSVTIFTTVRGRGDARTAEAALALGECLLSLGRRSEAAPLLEESHGLLQKTLGDNHPTTQRADAARRRAG
jgi:serine/threonine-protein kinase